MLFTLYESFWKDEYWLPSGYTWADLEDSDGITYPHPKDLLAVIPTTFVLLVIRYVSERFIGLPLSKALGVRDSIRTKPIPNPILESFFQTHSKSPTKDELNHLASQCSLSMRQAERWFRHRRNQERPLLSKKFSETCWRFLFYFCSLSGGFLIFYNKTWLSQPETHLHGYPKQPLNPALYWWYIMEISFYFSLLLTLSFDIKRKDFKEQIIHHCTTISLMSVSYCANLVISGAIVLLLHDVSDVFLEAGKMLNYAKWRVAQNIVFVFFTLMFIITRIFFFPIRFIYIVISFFETNGLQSFVYHFCLTLLLVIMSLNVFWTSLILKMLFKLFSEGQVKKDVRSDREESDMSDEQLTTKQQSDRRLQSDDVTNIRFRRVQGTGQLVTEAVPMA
ncbi:ceramide synthase 4-like [Sarcophilus harrisii]|uniref:ceramide synthase 4-like n=1 Tax=Sarcophilus harrisii TaxID=9305 RepID=UPI000226DC0A|nr:ceramide synthase 4-like [Sarcophilus harrisii]